MRTNEEMMRLINDFIAQDDVLVGYMQGSKISNVIPKDKYQDYDILFIVQDIKKYTHNHAWIKRFGEILIVQMPEDFYDHPYDYNGNEPFNYLIQFKDGNRIDISLVDINNMDKVIEDNEPKTILVNKINFPITDIKYDGFYDVIKPSQFEFNCTCNEFYWLAIPCLKGIRRKELGYVKKMMEYYQFNMLNKMISFKIGLIYNFNVNVGKCYKYFKNYLTSIEMDEYRNCYPNSDFNDIYDKLLNACVLFNKTAVEVANKLKYDYNEQEALNIIEYIRRN